MCPRHTAAARFTKRIRSGRHAGLDPVGSGSTLLVPLAWAAQGTGGHVWAVAWGRVVLSLMAQEEF
eukprot:10903300-Karenia_brevis.AAC.1